MKNNADSATSAQPSSFGKEDHVVLDDRRKKQTVRVYRQSSLALSPPQFDEELQCLSHYTPQEVCGIELETFSFTVSTHVLDYFKDELEDTVKAHDLRAHINRRVAVGGWMVASKPSRTKKGERMKFINLDDTTGMIDVVIFPQCYYECASIIRTAGPYKVWGIVKEEFGVVNVVAERVELLAD